MLSDLFGPYDLNASQGKALKMPCVKGHDPLHPRLDRDGHMIGVMASGAYDPILYDNFSPKPGAFQRRA